MWRPSPWSGGGSTFPRLKTFRPQSSHSGTWLSGAEPYPHLALSWPPLPWPPRTLWISWMVRKRPPPHPGVSWLRSLPERGPPALRGLQQRHRASPVLVTRSHLLPTRTKGLGVVWAPRWPASAAAGLEMRSSRGRRHPAHHRQSPHTGHAGPDEWPALLCQHIQNAASVV